MSKVRVYELARELGLEHTVVEVRCRELGIAVENHLAQLTSEDVRLVKKALADNPAGEVTQKRVRKTVIRRRRRDGDRTTVRRKEEGAAAEAAEPAPTPTPAAIAASAPIPPARPVAPVIQAPPVEVEAPPAEVEAPPAEAAPGPVVSAEPEAAAVPAVPSVPDPEPTPVERAPVVEAPLPGTGAAHAEPSKAAASTEVAAPVVPMAAAPIVEAPPDADDDDDDDGTEPANGEASSKKRKARTDTQYGDRTAVNRGDVPRPKVETRESYVKVVGRIDPALAQNLSRVGRRAGPAPAGGPPRRPGPPVGVRPGGPAGPGRAVNIPLADRSDKPGAATDRTREQKGKKRRGGRVAYDRTKDARFRGSQRPRGRRGAKGKKRTGQATEITIPKASKRVVKMDATITVGELAQQLSIKAGVIIKYLMGLGEMVTVNHVVDLDTVTLIAQEYEFTVENVAFNVESFMPSVDEETAEYLPRSPVVTVMGHVDHGKTSLLDHIRKARVAAGEAGGITQHIGAYKVPVKVAGKKRELVFLDTPGHAAFTAMRARGAQVTDVVILVVAADDGVMPQTIEAITHSRAADVPIVVAVNKCDKADADPERVRRELTEHGLVPEEWGGEVQMLNVSAVTGEGVPELLESVYLQAELLELTAVADGMASGIVIEAELSRGRGAVATVLVQQGTLRRGDIVVAGKATGRVRALLDDKGRQVADAGPANPVEVLGLDEVPPPSERFFVVKDEREARQIVNHLQDKDRERRLAQERKRISLEDLTKLAQAGEVKTLALIIKSDVQGSLEALRGAFEKLQHEELDVRILHGAVGPISESDVGLAAASDAVIIGFNVRPEKTAKAAADQEGVEIKLYSVIYDAIEDVKAAMEGLLSPIVKESFLGKAEVRDTFHLKGAGTVAGCAVLQGKLVRNGLARLVRDGIVIWSGKIDSLRRFKQDVPEVDRGHECGARLDNYSDVKTGDEIECYELVEQAQKLQLEEGF